MFTMKSSTKTFPSKWALVTVLSVFILTACQDQNAPTKQEEIRTKANSNVHGHLKQTKTYSSDVAIRWMNMQLRIMSTTALPNVAFSRPYAYSGIAL